MPARMVEFVRARVIEQFTVGVGRCPAPRDFDVGRAPFSSLSRLFSQRRDVPIPELLLMISVSVSPLLPQPEPHAVLESVGSATQDVLDSARNWGVRTGPEAARSSSRWLSSTAMVWFSCSRRPESVTAPELATCPAVLPATASRQATPAWSLSRPRWSAAAQSRTCSAVSFRLVAMWSMRPVLAGRRRWIVQPANTSQIRSKTRSGWRPRDALIEVASTVGNSPSSPASRSSSRSR